MFRKKFLGATLLVAGTSIGGGMLMIPVLTGIAGFFPAIVITCFCFLLMTATGLLFVELSLSFKGEPNFITIADKTLGKFGKLCTWFLYLFFFYCLTTAYVDGGGAFIDGITSSMISKPIATAIFTLVLGVIVLLGEAYVDRMNTLFFGGLIITFILFVFIGAPSVKASNLQHSDWNFSFLSIPILAASFGYQGVIPSLTTYLKRSPRSIVAAIICGTAITCVCYIVWQWLILGIVPLTGEGGLHSTFLHKENVIFPLRHLLDHPWVYQCGHFFSFFALVTSFLGVGLGLLDFLADGLNIHKDSRGRLLLSMLVFVPPFLFSLFFHKLFFIAFNYGGGIGALLLLALLPIIMTWRARYHYHIPSLYRLPGGKGMLVFLFILLIVVIGVQSIHELGLSEIPSDFEILP